MSGLYNKEGMLARDNYSYQKYRRELAKKKKKEEKMQRKLDKKKEQPNTDQSQAPNEDVARNPEIYDQDNKVQ